ncbi:ankyrin repeat domain-containing protein [Wolbachia endosymbiont (group B) of Endotricha flammealis]|uniref:ankyrin repeat domain-containing protein n=1 Tax=Wolbachia endosymbiont (group B) of Endotricha flammealis TaxID=2954005 RepID=UPI00222E4B26|nr:ankyrin repeat domain-containing protein [Wolbachia endosymbiont (group B) of Endotricha flammealis]
MVLSQQQQEINSKLLKSSEDIYNSYLLLYKLNKIKDDSKSSLKDLISEAINQSKEQVEFKVKGNSYKVNITKKGDNYELEVLGGGAKPEIKDVLEYTDKDIINLWAQSKVSFEKDLNNNYAFAIEIKDEIRNQDLKIGGQGKKVPFSLRFANFYKVIEILKDTNTALSEKLRLANNIATGSGKTGDIALLKLSCYLANIPCITIVPTEALKEQASNFDKEFLPDLVAEEFAKPFYDEKAECLVRKDINNFENEHKDKKDYKTEHGSETFQGYYDKVYYSWKEFQADRSYVTATFKDAFHHIWKPLSSTYTQDKPCLICIDEAPNLKSNPVYLARAKEISQHHPTAIFTATPDKFLNEEFNISNQILLSPTERAELEIGKLPKAHLHQMKSQGKDIVEAYIKKVDNTHEKLSSCNNAIAKFKEERKKTSDSFLNLINESLDSQIYKTTLIATEEKDWLGIHYAIRVRGNEQNQKEEIKKSFMNAIRELESGLEDDEIESLVNENLNIEVGDKLHRSIKLHNIIDTFNEYKKSGMEVTEEKVSKFIKDKYCIVDYVDPKDSSSNLPYNTELTRSICTLNTIEDKYQKSIERNYPGDKKLHEYIFKTYPKLTAFCEKDLHLSYFEGSFGLYDQSKRDENLLNMVKAGFVPVIFSKELGIGIDAPRLNRAAAIITSPSDMSNPMFLLQFMGRVGRDVNSRGLCYFDLFTATKNFFNPYDVAKLSGEDLNEKLLDRHQKYITDMNYILEAKSRALSDFIIQMINKADNDNRIGSYIIGVEKCIKKEFKNININYGFNKETSMKLFTKVLSNSYSELKDFHTHTVITDNGIDDVIKTLESQDANIEVKRLRPYNSIPSLVYWAKEMVQIQPICGNELLNADSESKKTIFVESSADKKVIEDIKSYKHKPRDIKHKPRIKVSDLPVQGSVEIRTAYSVMFDLEVDKITTKQAIDKLKKLNIDYANPNDDVKEIIRLGYEYLEILDFFIENGLNVNNYRPDLMISLCNRTKANPKVLERLIERGAKVDVKDEHGNTPLHLACKKGHIELVRILIKNQANIASENREGQMPLYFAAQNPDLSCAKFLIECLLKADSYREMPLLLNEDRELLEHWNYCKDHTREKTVNAVRKSTATTQNMQRSKIAVTLAMIAIPAALIAHFVFQASLLVTGVIAGCCLVAAAIIYYCNSPSSSLENSNVKVVTNEGHAIA